MDIYGENCPIYLTIWYKLRKHTNHFQSDEGEVTLDMNEYIVSDVLAVLKRFYNNVYYYEKDSNVRFTFKGRKLK